MKKIGMVFLALFLFALQLSAKEAGGNGLTLTTINGKKLHFQGTTNGLQIDRYKGKIVFLEFWGTHCPPCLMSVPHYIELTKKYGDKLAVVAVEVQDTPAPVLKKFAKSHGVNYDVIDYRTGMPLVNYISQRTKWSGSIPFLTIFDQQGNFVTAQVGLLPQDALEGVIKTLEKIEAKRKKAPATSSKESNASK
ncbi:TlpA disulfide reductase family protein [Nitratifractor sp.]|uniref:TlpA family protein disulfide reductase n=1 Tax=Nitratifractor sp. TaxID=2268144 RepID=UPI0025D99B74|nr:TlpA disulfide reductase family protein [Nitratifractor sp.]